MNKSCALFLLFPGFGNAQFAWDKPGIGVTRGVEADCDTFARVTKDFLKSRGLVVQQQWGLALSDWDCGGGYRCIVFIGTGQRIVEHPRSADGKELSRDDVVRDYLTQPDKADFHPKSYGHGYWAVPDRNFFMGASLQLKKIDGGCSAKLNMGFGLRATMYLVVLPYGLPSWDFPPDNGRLQTEYMDSVVKRLPKIKQ